jgi:hypothetical protein
MMRLSSTRRRQHTCFACGTLMPRHSLHFQHIPAGHRGRQANARVLMCSACHQAQGAVNKADNRRFLIAGAIFLAAAALIRVLM